MLRFWCRQWNKALVMRCYTILKGATLSYVKFNMLKGTRIGLHSTTRYIHSVKLRMKQSSQGWFSTVLIDQVI